MIHYKLVHLGFPRLLNLDHIHTIATERIIYNVLNQAVPGIHPVGK